MEQSDKIISWFDWFSLIINLFVSIVSIAGGYFIANRIYRKEKTDKEIEEQEITTAEIKLFKNSIFELNNAIKNQLKSLITHRDNKDFKLEVDDVVQIDFLHFVQVGVLYRNEGLNQTEKIDKINKLLSSLYLLNNFRPSLRDEMRAFMQKYNYHENKFYDYRKLLYTRYFELCNERTEDIVVENGVKLFKPREGDMFLQQYITLVNQTFANTAIIKENGLQDRAKLIEDFIVPLASMAGAYIPEDGDAIEINDLANEVNAAFVDMENVVTIHLHAIQSYINVLDGVSKQIADYLQERR